MQKCPICNCNKYRLIGLNPDFENCNIVQCKKCRFFFTKLTQNCNLRKYYISQYRETRNETITESYLEFQNTRAIAQLNFIKNNINFTLENITVLEIGCGSGMLLKQLNSFNNRLFAFEADKKMYEYVKNAIPNINIVNDIYEDSHFSQEKYDLIVMSHVFEHMENPNKLLADLKNKLTPGGVLFLEIPNENKESIDFMINHQKGVGHLIFFSPQQIKKMIKYYFENCCVETYTFPLELYIENLRQNLGSNCDMSKKFTNGIHIRCVAGNIVKHHKDNTRNHISLKQKLKSILKKLPILKQFLARWNFLISKFDEIDHHYLELNEKISNLKKPNKENTGLNIGGGAWVKQGWKNLDWYTDDKFIDYKINLLEDQKLPISSNKFLYAFSSHVIEHLQDEKVSNLFSEVYRVLDNGGIFRLSCPNADAALDAYKNKKNDFFFENNEVFLVGDTIEKRLVNFFASFACKNYCGEEFYQGGPSIEVSVIAEQLDNLTKDDFIQWCVSQIPKEAHYVAHINGFYYNKIFAMLKNAGFEIIFKSAYKKSIVKEMREDCFDNRPIHSIFVECIKI